MFFIVLITALVLLLLVADLLEHHAFIMGAILIRLGVIYVALFGFSLGAFDAPYIYVVNTDASVKKIAPLPGITKQIGDVSIKPEFGAVYIVNLDPEHNMFITNEIHYDSNRAGTPAPVYQDTLPRLFPKLSVFDKSLARAFRNAPRCLKTYDSAEKTVLFICLKSQKEKFKSSLNERSYRKLRERIDWSQYDTLN